MSKLTAAMLIIVGMIHLLPLSGALGANRLSALYGLDFSNPDLQILMRHRAVLFGILGAFLIVAAALPGLRPAALVAGWISVLSFLAIAWGVGGYGEAIRRVVMADLVAAACLAIATVAWMLHLRSGG